MDVGAVKCSLINQTNSNNRREGNNHMSEGINTERLAEM
jgi:hypothetical protein